MAERNIRQIAERLVDNLRAYKEPLIRESVFSQKVKELPADLLADIVMHVISRAYQKEEKFLEIVDMFTDKALLKNSLGEKGMYELTRSATEKGYKEFAVFWIESRHRPQNREPKSMEVDEPLPDPALGGMPLGIRKSLSKTHNRDVIEKLLYDPEPSVVRGLLDNPRITERDVVKIASRRPTTDKIARTVYSHEKWKHRYSVQCSLAMNPYTPAEISLKILPKLFSADLEEIMNDSRLSDIVRMQARIVLTQGVVI